MWRDRAACKGMPLELFFGRDGERQAEREERERRAAAVCARCPVWVECLEYALTQPEHYGVWGGSGENARRLERRRRQRAAARQRRAVREGAAAA